MKKLGLVAIVCIGLLSFTQAIGLLASTGPFLFSLGMHERGLMIAGSFYLVAVLAAVLMGVVLVFYRWDVAGWLFDDDDAETTIASTSTAMQVAIVVTGLYFVITSVPSLLVGAINIASESAKFGALAFTPGNWLALPAIKLIFGIGLMWRSAKLADFFAGDRDKPSDAADLPVEQTRACPVCGAPFDPADYRPGAERTCSACHSVMEVGGE